MAVPTRRREPALSLVLAKAALILEEAATRPGMERCASARSPAWLFGWPNLLPHTHTHSLTPFCSGLALPCSPQCLPSFVSLSMFVLAVLGPSGPRPLPSCSWPASLARRRAPLPDPARPCSRRAAGVRAPISHLFFCLFNVGDMRGKPCARPEIYSAHRFPFVFCGCSNTNASLHLKKKKKNNTETAWKKALKDCTLQPAFGPTTLPPFFPFAKLPLRGS